MGFGSLLSKGIGMALKYAPRVGKALGQISEGGRKFGTVMDAGRKLGTTLDVASGGKIGNSKFGRNVNNLADKADMVTSRVVSEASKAQGEVGVAAEKLARV